MCEWVYDNTDDNETAARLADWLVGRPFQVLVIFVIAWIAKTLARWMIKRGVRRLMVPPSAVT